MSDDLDTLFAAPVTAAPERAEHGGIEQSTELARLLGAPDLASVSGSSLLARGQLVDTHRRLLEVEKIIKSRRQAIELAFIRAGAENEADEIRTAEGVVKLKPEAGSYESKPDTMRHELERLLADGVLSKEELEEACPVTITTTVNHTKLNYLAKHRGEAVRAIIEAHRKKLEPDRLRAKPVFPKPT